MNLGAFFSENGLPAGCMGAIMARAAGCDARSSPGYNPKLLAGERLARMKALAEKAHVASCRCRRTHYKKMMRR